MKKDNNAKKGNKTIEIKGVRKSIISNFEVKQEMRVRTVKREKYVWRSL
jgi:hypothetical protein